MKGVGPGIKANIKVFSLTKIVFRALPGLLFILTLSSWKICLFG